MADLPVIATSLKPSRLRQVVQFTVGMVKYYSHVCCVAFRETVGMFGHTAKEVITALVIYLVSICFMSLVFPLDGIFERELPTVGLWALSAALVFVLFFTINLVRAPYILDVRRETDSQKVQSDLNKEKTAATALREAREEDRKKLLTEREGRLALRQELSAVQANNTISYDAFNQLNAKLGGLGQQLEDAQAALNEIVVRVIDCEIIGRSDEYITFNLVIMNCSPLIVSTLEGPQGFIQFNTRRLGVPTGGSLSRRGQFKNVTQGDHRSIHVRQDLTPEDAIFLNQNQGIQGKGYWFDLSSLQLLACNNDTGVNAVAEFTFDGITIDNKLIRE